MLLYIVIGIVSILLLALCFFLGYQYRKRNAEKEIGSAEQEATRILNEALKSAESKKREALVEAREEIHRERSSYEQEVKERRSEPVPSRSAGSSPKRKTWTGKRTP